MLLFSHLTIAQDSVAEIAVGEAGVDKDKFVIDDPEMKSLSGSQTNLSKEFIDILRNNFSFYRHKFNNVDYSEKGKDSFSKPQIQTWKESGITYFIASQFSSEGSAAEARVKAWSVLTGKELFSDKKIQWRGASVSDWHSIRQKRYLSFRFHIEKSICI
jgi:hypothetical protein